MTRKVGISLMGASPRVGGNTGDRVFLSHRVRLAMQDEKTNGKLNGEIEVDETFIGCEQRNMHKGRKLRVQKEGRNYWH